MAEFVVTRDWLETLKRQAEMGEAITLPAEQMRALLTTAQKGLNTTEKSATILKFPAGGVDPK